MSPDADRRPQTPTTRRLHGLAMLLLVVFAVRLVDTARSNSLTADEPSYIGTGLYLWASGDYDYYWVLGGHPPLAFHLAALPLLMVDLGDLPLDRGVGPALVAGSAIPPMQVRLLSRLPFVLLSLWGAVLVFAWAREAAGPGAGLLALFVYSNLPAVLAYGALAHSDIAVSVFMLQTLYAAWRWQRQRSLPRALAVGLSLGLALGSKLSALLLLPALVAAALVAVFGGESGPKSWQNSRGGTVLQGLLAVSGWMLLWGLCALGVLWFTYGASSAIAVLRFSGGAEMPVPAFAASLMNLLEMNAGGRAVFFLGEIAKRRAVETLPLLWLLKAPLALLLLIALAALPRRTAASPVQRGALRVAATGIVVFLAAAFFALRLPMGVRYLLPATLLVPLPIALRLAGAGRRRFALLACVGLGAESLLAHPHYIAYFGPLARGFGPPERIAVDADLDWGQGLPALAAELGRREIAEVGLAYAGAESPAQYGIRWRFQPPCERGSGWLAISASIASGLYSQVDRLAPPNPTCWDWLREFEPAARVAGGAFLLYDIPPLRADWTPASPASEAPRREPPDLLLISVDALRSDALGSYGNPAARTPNLDALALESRRYARAISTAPHAAPALASLLSGLWPPHHGVRTTLLQELAPEVTTLAELLADSGYATAAFVSTSALAPRFGFAQGFARYSAPEARAKRPLRERSATAAIDEALLWFGESPREAPLFAWIQLADPSAPHRPPPGFEPGVSPRATAHERSRARYQAEVNFADREIGRLFEGLDALGRWRDLVVVVVGAYGEALDAGGAGFGATWSRLDEATLRVPLLLRAPGRVAAGVDGRLVSPVDLMPTLLDLFGFAPPAGLDGRSLLDPAAAERPVYSETFYPDFPRLAGSGGASRALTVGDHRLLLRGKQVELYDLRSDPQQQRDLAAGQAGTVEQLRSELDALDVDARGRAIRFDLPLRKRRAHEKDLRDASGPR